MSDDEILIAEVTHTRRVVVYADVVQVCAENATDRARHADQSDFEYVLGWVQADPFDFVRDSVGDDGFRVEEDYDDIDVDAFSEPS